jgi:hypothetical protein
MLLPLPGIFTLSERSSSKFEIGFYSSGKPIATDCSGYDRQSKVKVGLGSSTVTFCVPCWFFLFTLLVFFLGCGYCDELAFDASCAA